MSDVTHMSTGKPECDAALDYAYGMLDGQEKARFEAHLSGCARCQAEVEAMGHVRAVAREVLPVVEPGDRLTGALHAQLMHAAAQRKPKGKVLPFVRRIVSHPGYAAAASLVIIGGVLGLQWSRNALMMPAPKHAAAPAEPPPPPAAPPPIVAEPAEAPKAEVQATQQPTGTAGVIDGKLAKTGAEPPSKDQPFAVTTAMPKPAPASRGRGSVADAPGDSVEGVGGYAAEKKLATKDLEQAKEATSTVAKQDEKPSSTEYRGKNAAPKGGKAAPDARPETESSMGSGRTSAQAAAPTVPPASSAPSAAPAAPSRSSGGPAPAKSSQAAARADADDARAPVAQRRNAEEAPAQLAAPTDKNARGSDGSNALGHAQGAGGRASAQLEDETARDAVKAEANAKAPAPDPIDAERSRAGQLVQVGRCDEAVQIYQGVERRAPDRLSAQDRLSYTRCLRTLGRLEPAQGELDQLRNNRQNITFPAAALDAEQKAINMERKRQAESNYASQEHRAAPAAKAKKKSVPAKAADDALDAEPSNKANIKRAY